MKTLLSILLLTLPFNTSAASVMLGGWSHHLHKSESKTYNEKNDLIAIEYDGWIGGTFVNTFDDRTFFAGYNFESEFKYLSFGAIAGMSKGYKPEDKKLAFGDNYMPIVMPYVQINTPYVKPVLGLLGNAVFLTFRIDFN
ncbi:hypothetical protein [Vibrio casei]|uniref:hypothetical protein n=1 Tax=Vibrio casei TaxID=673372 RepID=UPI003F9D0319